MSADLVGAGVGTVVAPRPAVGVVALSASRVLGRWVGVGERTVVVSRPVLGVVQQDEAHPPSFFFLLATSTQVCYLSIPKSFSLSSPLSMSDWAR